MRVAAIAQYFRARFRQAVVNFFADIDFGYRRVKTSPTRIRIKFIFRAEKRQITAHAIVNARLVIFIERA